MEKRTELACFQTLEFKRSPWTRWASSLAIHAALLIAIILLPVSVSTLHRSPARMTTVSLTAPRPLAPRVTPSVKKLQASVVIPPVMKPLPRLPFQLPPQSTPPRPAVTPELALPQPAPLWPQPKPLETKIAAPGIELPKPAIPDHPVARQEVFASTSTAPAGPGAAVRTVKTGTFGDPNGVQASATSASKALTVAQTGSFDASPGWGPGNGASKGRVVASAGFGSAGTAGSSSGGPGRGAVRGAGFGEFVPAPVSARAAPAAPRETPVEITFKPKPAYTPEAREKRLEGDIQLEVLFSATGQVRVLRLLHGLGSGLDENARSAASQIRFHPATRDGNPVDVTGTVHIVFELS
jgi:TonB family protein